MSLDDAQKRTVADWIAQGQKLSEIQKRLAVRHRQTFRENYVRPALQRELLEMTLPDRPSSRLQKYRLTAAGAAVLAALRKLESTQ